MKENLRPGYGQLLAEARAAKGLSQADVAAKIKLTVRQVEAMESEDTEQLPGDIFLRGFVRNYARLVELDPGELITPLDAQAAVSETITAHSEDVTISSGGLRRWVIVPLVILLVFVIFVAVLYQWLRQGEDALLPQSAVEQAPAVVSQQLPPPSGEAGGAPPQSPLTIADGDGAAALAPDSLASAPDAMPAAVATVPPAAAVALEATAPPATPPKPVVEAVEARPKPRESAAVANTHVLRFLAEQDAWIQVVDGEGKRFSKLIRAGGTDSISGAAPFKLVVGEAAQVTLTYDGHPIDLTPFIGQKVARLTLE